MSLSRRFSSPSSSPVRIIFPYGEKLDISLSDFPDGRTKQSFRDECDINRIMARYIETGMLEGRDPNAARYLDVTDLQSMDYQAALNFVIDAQASFFDLPSAIRSRFQNDPGALIAFLDNPVNKDEAIRLGLLPNPDLQSTGVPLGTPNPDSSPADQAK